MTHDDERRAFLRGSRRQSRSHVGRVFAASASALLVLACGEPAPPPTAETPANPGTLAGSGACRGCHPAAFEAWRGSPHDRAFEAATSESVLGNFDDTTFEGPGIRARFYRSGTRFHVETLGADGQPTAFDVAYVIGFDPLQQLVIEAPSGRLQAFSVAWDSRESRWIALAPGDVHPGDWLHWTGAAMNADTMCIECHATNVTTGFSEETGAVTTTWSEIDVACEACHGPRQDHVNWAARHPDALPTAFRGSAPEDRDRLRQQSELESCAPCHSRRRRIHASPEAREPFHDRYAIETIRDDLYFPDGQIRDEVYVLGSFMTSRMYTEGVRCSHCHDPHTTQLVAEGNALCSRCHDPLLYDSPSHHHHPQDSEGSQCVECHMRERTYMRVDPRRDHGFHLPRPDLSVEFGTPNACNACHDDRDAAWARDRVIEWYGPERPFDIHATRAFAASRAGQSDAGALLAEVFHDTRVPALVRATALERLGLRGDPERLNAIEAGLTSEDPVVRSRAVAATQSLPRDERAARVEPLLEDPSRGVRTEAARIVAGASPERLRAPPSSENRAFFQALGEFEAAQRSLALDPGAHLNLAVLALNRGDPKAAESHYLRALALDRDFLPARFNLAMLYDALGRGPEAETQLRAAVSSHPEDGEAHYSLGLLLAADPVRGREAALALARAAAALPHRPRVQYNAGLAAQRLRQFEQAERFLLAALHQAPDAPDFAQAVAILYAQQERWEDAWGPARHHQNLRPNDPEAKRLLDHIEAERAAPR